MSEKDPINPSYYVMHGLETIDIIEAAELGFCLGNAVKYIVRAGKKDPSTEIEDLKKAEWYIKRRIIEIKIADPDDGSSNITITTTNPKLSEDLIERSSNTCLL